MNIKHLSTELDPQNETIRYWFEVDGQQWCMADCRGDVRLLDADGYPIDSPNNEEHVIGMALAEETSRLSIGAL